MSSRISHILTRRSGCSGVQKSQSVIYACLVSIDFHACFTRKLKRKDALEFMIKQPKCLVAIEVCGGSYYWVRALQV